MTTPAQDLTALADKLDELAMKATPTPWDGIGGTYAYPSGVRDPKMRVADFGGDSSFQNADLVFALVNNLPTLTTALREAARLREVEAKPITLNVNETIRVKLTRAGRDALRKAHQERWGPILAYSEPKEDAEGYSRWQVWSIMADLGPHIHMSMSEPLFESWNIEIPRAALKQEESRG